MAATPKDLEAAPTVKTYEELPSPMGDANVNGEPREPGGASLLLLVVASMPSLAMQMGWAAQWAALGPYLGMMLPVSAVKATQIIGPLSGILVGPIVGVMSDRSTNKWGRRRPFLVIAGILSIVCWNLMGFTREIAEAFGDYGNGWQGTDTSRNWTAILTVFFFLWMDITIKVMQIPAFLLVADIAGDRQVTGAVLVQSWASIGSLALSLYIEIWGTAYLTIHSFLGLLSGVLVVCLVVVCVVVKETPHDPTMTSTLVGIGQSFTALFSALCSLPLALGVYGLVTFCASIGFTLLASNRREFFGRFVYSGESNHFCEPHCSPSQDDFNRGMKLVEALDYVGWVIGCTVLLLLPLVVRRAGAKWVATAAFVPLASLTAMAFSKVVPLNVMIVALVSLSQNVVYALVVPLCVHVMGDQQDIGVYVGVINSVSGFASLINYFLSANGPWLFETGLGYQLPVLIAGTMGALGLGLCAVFFRVKMYSL